MARPLRIQAPGLTYHVTSRGNARMPIYLDDEDRHGFLALLADRARHFRLTCHSYCLMTNHYHAVITTAEANLSDAMRDINGDYAQWWNRRHRRVGHAFQGRFDGQIVQDAVYFLTVCRYVVLNPVRARLVATPEAWPWSSYRATCGMCPKPACLATDFLLAQFADDPRGPIEAYRQFIGAARVGEKLPRSPVIGDKAFSARFKAAADAASPEVPRRGRDVEQLSLPQLLLGALTREERDARIVSAYEHGFHLAEIGRTLGIHYTTVSKIVKRCQVRKKAMIQDLTPPVLLKT
jgi:putative transposase